MGVKVNRFPNYLGSACNTLIAGRVGPNVIQGNDSSGFNVAICTLAFRSRILSDSGKTFTTNSRKRSPVNIRTLIESSEKSRTGILQLMSFVLKTAAFTQIDGSSIDGSS